MSTRHLLPGILALLPFAAFAQTAPSAAETKLRDALRASTSQLRQVQDDLASARASLEAKTTELDALLKKSRAETRKLTGDLEATTAKLKEQADLAERTAAKLRETHATAVRRQTEIETLTAALLRADADRARLRTVKERLSVRLAHRETQNVELVNLAETILTRFEQYGLGEAIAGKESFIGVKRVALRNFVQDHADRIVAAKVAPGAPAPAESVPAVK